MRLVAATTRTSILRGRVEPSGVISRSCRNRSSLACSSWGMSPISSRNRVPPSASSNRPRLSLLASEWAPRAKPNSSLSMSSRGMAAQLMVTNRPPAAAAVVDGPRVDLLAHARLPMSSSSPCDRASLVSFWVSSASVGEVVPTRAKGWLASERKAASCCSVTRRNTAT